MISRYGQNLSHLPKFLNKIFYPLQFRYRWAFVGSDTCTNKQPKGTADFIPHVTRISRLMEAKVI